jgi:hypothetical protein
MRITEAFRRYGVELTNPQFTSSAVGDTPRQVVVSLWSHNFTPDMSRYGSGISKWKGAGKHIFIRHLRLAQEEDLPIRVVVATSADPEEVSAGNATRTDNDFEPDFSLVGRVVSLSDDGFELAFERTGIPPEEIVAERARSTVKYWHVAEAVEALGKPSSTSDIRAWLADHYPHEDHSDLGANLSFLTVNDANRRHYDKSRKNWRSDSGHPRDRLYRQGRFRATTFEVFRPSAHGHWDLQPNAEGIWGAIPIAPSELGQAEAQAQEAAFEQLPPLDSDHDARVWTLTAVAQRQGQGVFRARLLEAYGSRCAITGSNAVAVLEAAHILPYRGEHTNRVDNGLLLRSDLHTLFDLGLLWITPENTVAIAPPLIGTDYENLDGASLRLPAKGEHHPNPAHLDEHSRLAQEKHR